MFSAAPGNSALLPLLQVAQCCSSVVPVLLQVAQRLLLACSMLLLGNSGELQGALACSCLLCVAPCGSALLTVAQRCSLLLPLLLATPGDSRFSQVTPNCSRQLQGYSGVAPGCSRLLQLDPVRSRVAPGCSAILQLLLACSWLRRSRSRLLRIGLGCSGVVCGCSKMLLGCSRMLQVASYCS